MKKSILVIVFAVLSLILLNSFIIYKTDFLDESCGRCSGTEYCSACSNCSGCKHCSQNGGSCGVCSNGTLAPNKTYSSKRTASKKVKTKTPKLQVISTDPIEPKLYFEEDTIIYITAEKLNVRSGAGLQYSILTELSNGDIITVLENSSSEWIKIKIAKNNIEGYVYGKYL